MNKAKLIEIGYSGNNTHGDVELFLETKYNFNIRNVDCFTNIGSWNDYHPAIDFIPDGYKFFFKDYIKNETESEWFDRIINLALTLIIKFKIKK